MLEAIEQEAATVDDESSKDKVQRLLVVSVMTVSGVELECFLVEDEGSILVFAIFFIGVEYDVGL